MRILPKKVILVSSTMRLMAKKINLIAKELARRGLDVEILTDLDSIENFTKKDGLRVTNVYSLMLPEYNYSEKKFIRYLKKYKIDFEDFCFDEIIKPFERRTTIKKRLLVLFMLFEKYFQDKKPDCIFNFSHTLVDRTVFKVAEKMKILNLHCRPNSPIRSWTFGLSYKWDDIIKKEFLYKRIDKKTDDKISAYVSKFVSGETNLISVYLETLERRSKKTPAFENFKGFYDYVIVDKKILRNPFFPLHHALKEVLIKKTRSMLTENYHSEPNFDEKFIYFPFQVPNDASITVHAPKFYRQDLVVSAISRSLPDGYFLYVKEHPNEKGAIPLSWIKRVCSLPNVKLVPADTNSLDLIVNSRAVIVITSETGWEGLLCLKPVIVLGSPFYSKLGVTFDVEKIECLPEVIKTALRAKQIDKYSVHKAINALMKSSCDCGFFSLRDKDIKKIVDFMMKEYSYRIMKMSRCSGH